jgi:hypothetical protein
MRMRPTQVRRLVFLAALIAVLIYIANTRGLGLRLGGAPAALHGPFATEEAWIVDDIARDIAEMDAYPARGPIKVAVTLSNVAGVYHVATAATSLQVELDLRQDLWSPTQFAVLASATLAPASPAATRTPGIDQSRCALSPW